MSAADFVEQVENSGTGRIDLNTVDWKWSDLVEMFGIPVVGKLEGPVLICDVIGERTERADESQPMPTASEESQSVQDALIRMIEERRRVGVKRYGTALMTHNGRDALQDALEEAVDLATYLMQMVMERA